MLAQKNVMNFCYILQEQWLFNLNTPVFFYIAEKEPFYRELLKGNWNKLLFLYKEILKTYTQTHATQIALIWSHKHRSEIFILF